MTLLVIGLVRKKKKAEESELKLLDSVGRSTKDYLGNLLSQVSILTSIW